MGRLFLSIAFLAALSLLMRYSLRRGIDALALNLTFRGTVAAAMVVPLLLGREPVTPFARTVAGSWLWPVTTLSFWVAGIASLKSVQLGPLGASFTILRCSMVLPVAVAIFALREIALTPLTGLLAARLAGIALGLGTAVLYGYGYGRLRPGTGSDARPRGSWIAWAAASFAAQGAWETCLLGTRSYSQEASRFFLLLVFAGCFLLTIPILLVRRIGVGGREWKYGAILGLCAMLGTTYRLDAIRELGGLIVFPTTTIAGILVAQAAGRWIWGERLPYTWVGLVMGVTAILLMTLRFGP